MLGPLASILLLAVTGPPALPDPDADPDADARLALRWPTIAGCPTTAELSERIAELAPAIELGDDGTRHAEIELDQLPGSPPRWAVELRIEAPFGVQHNAFEAESCAVAADVVALLIAVALDPVEVAVQIDEARRAVPVEPAPEEEPTPQPAPAVDPPPADDEGTPNISLVLTDEEPPPTNPVERPAYGLALLGGGGFGPLRSGSATIAARFAVFGRHWRWQLGGAWLPPINLDLGQGWTARFDGWQLGTRACGVLHPAARLEVPLCGGVEAGAVRGRPLPDLPTATNATQPWVALELGPALSWVPRPRLAVGVEVDAVVPLLAAAFTLGGERVRQYSPVGVRALVAIELRLGPTIGGG